MVRSWDVCGSGQVTAKSEGLVTDLLTNDKILKKVESCTHPNMF